MKKKISYGLVLMVLLSALLLPTVAAVDTDEVYTSCGTYSHVSTNYICSGGLLYTQTVTTYYDCNYNIIGIHTGPMTPTSILC